VARCGGDSHHQLAQFGAAFETHDDERVVFETKILQFAEAVARVTDELHASESLHHVEAEYSERDTLVQGPHRL
jgi:hypothetical protein